MSLLTRRDVDEHQVLDVVVDDYGYTGEGYVRLQDGWLSVRGALPGENLRVKVQPGQRAGARRIFADIVEILEPSEDRRDPLCARIASCRGCQLRHLTISEEMRFKARTIAEVVEKYAQIPRHEQPEIEIISPLPISRSDGFRVRTVLHYVRTAVSFELGLISPGNDGLIPMDECPALTHAVQRTIQLVTRAFKELEELPRDRRMAEVAANDDREPPSFLRAVRVVIPNHGQGFVELQLEHLENVTSLYESSTNRPISRLVEKLVELLPDQVGVAVSNGVERHYAKPHIQSMTVPICGLKLEVGLDDWFHATLVPAEANYEAVMRLLNPESMDHLLDVGCGVGTFSLLCAPLVHRAVGIDRNLRSVEMARTNATRHDHANLSFLAGGWENGLRKLAQRGERFTSAVINPMREPLGKKPLAYLNVLGIEKVVYLGPSAASAAKDIKELCELGWHLDYLAGANLHPATYHTMLVARLGRESAQKTI